MTFTFWRLLTERKQRHLLILMWLDLVQQFMQSQNVPICKLTVEKNTFAAASRHPPWLYATAYYINKSNQYELMNNHNRKFK